MLQVPTEEDPHEGYTTSNFKLAITFPQGIGEILVAAHLSLLVATGP